MKKTILPILFLFLFLSVNCLAQNQDKVEVIATSENARKKLPIVENRPIKNVIFLIGDGTGFVQLTSGQYATVGAAGLLAIQTMPVSGIVKTYSANSLITDSASGATAYSCGEKTDNGMIGQLPDGSDCKTVLELAEEKGLSTGLVSTSGITHATPASYAAHVPSRSMQSEIAEDFLTSGVEVFLGGGTEYFIPKSESGSKREDNRNLIEEFKSNGYEFLSNKEDIDTTKGDKLLGLFAPSGLPSEGRTPTLAEMSKKAIEVLSTNENGFFLMIEGSQIDWGGHGNDAQYVVNEVKDFDNAVEEVLAFAEKNGETLVVLTADHETGGMTINDTNEEKDEIEIVWTTTHHTGSPVPLLAYGPYAIEFTGWMENTEVGQKISELLGVGTLPIKVQE